MTLHATRLRGAVVRAVGILDDPTLSPDFRAQSALDVLRAALGPERILSPAQRAARDADPGVQAALARIREGGTRPYYRVPCTLPVLAG